MLATPCLARVAQGVALCLCDWFLDRHRTMPFPFHLRKESQRTYTLDISMGKFAFVALDALDAKGFRGSYLQQPLGARSVRSSTLRAAGPPEMAARGRSGLQRRGHSQVCPSLLGAPMCRSLLGVSGSQQPLKYLNLIMRHHPLEVFREAVSAGQSFFL